MVQSASSLIKTRFVFKNRKFLYPHEAELIRIEVDPQWAHSELIWWERLTENLLDSI